MERQEERGLTRRELLSAIGAGAPLAAACASASHAAASGAPAAVPATVLGRTGRRVSRLGFGGSWDVDAGVLAAGVDRGINYFDTAEGYGSGMSERAMGAFIGSNCRRDQVYVVTKTFRHHQLEMALTGSLRRLQMDYVDTLYLHDVRDPRILSAPDVKAAAERLKRTGRIRFCGFSCHHPPVLAEALELGAQTGIYDVVMFRYSYRDRDTDAVNRAIDACAKAKMGLVAMKTLADPAHIPAKFDTFTPAGMNKAQACLRAVWADERIHAVVSEMVNQDYVEQNCAAAMKPLSAAEDAALRRHAALTEHLFCRGCEHLCAAAAGSTVAVADILRFQLYHDRYDKRARARELYAALPAPARDLSAGDWARGEAACPHGVPVRRLLEAARRTLA